MGLLATRTGVDKPSVGSCLAFYPKPTLSSCADKKKKGNGVSFVGPGEESNSKASVLKAHEVSRDRNS